ncbi:hypothetical protein SBV1_510003 [Verrucomicrobia bacterium]|nr:hypothetical protein SBV1_510003 [Verrucomicrobiota bacterium]
MIAQSAAATVGTPDHQLTVAAPFPGTPRTPDHQLTVAAPFPGTPPSGGSSPPRLTNSLTHPSSFTSLPLLRIPSGFRPPAQPRTLLLAKPPAREGFRSLLAKAFGACSRRLSEPAREGFRSLLAKAFGVRSSGLGSHGPKNHAQP